jgi:hypothetical protein
MSKGDIYTPSESRVSDVGFASARRAYEPSGSGSLPSARMSHINDSMRRENATLNRTIRTTSPSPIAFILDDTGSMGDWVDTIYEKMPMFYGQTILQGYLDKPAISFCLTGDAYYDSAPLQVTDFAEGDTIDKKIESRYI